MPPSNPSAGSPDRNAASQSSWSMSASEQAIRVLASGPVRRSTPASHSAAALRLLQPAWAETRPSEKMSRTSLPGTRSRPRAEVATNVLPSSPASAAGAAPGSSVAQAASTGASTASTASATPTRRRACLAMSPPRVRSVQGDHAAADGGPPVPGEALPRVRDAPTPPRPRRGTSVVAAPAHGHPRRMGRTDTYTFGDGDLAARRLARLAEVFDPPTRAALTEWCPGPVGHAVDLGAGPGLTTRLLHDAVRPATVTAVERSPHHAARAREALSDVPGAVVVEHDVTVAPLPVPPADVVLTRFLLTHLADPGAALALWATALTPGGRLLAQETARMASAEPVLARYYELVADLQRHHGQALDVGRAMPDLAAAVPGVRVVHAGVREVRPAPAAMAALHAMNVRTWRTDPYAAAAFDAAELDDVTARLDAIAGGAPCAPVEVDLAEVVLERA